MAKKIIRTGTTADPIGDSLKNAFIKVNDNFTELYNALGLDVDLLNLGAFEFTGSVMTTTDSSAIVIDQATTITSNLTVGGDLLPSVANGGDLGSSSLPWRSLYVSNNTIYIGGTAVGVDANGALTTGGTVVGSSPDWNSITGKPTFATVATSGAYSDLTGKPTIPTLVSQLANDSGFLTSVGNISNIQSESDVIIQVNLTDSTTRIWSFGEDGLLTFPNGTNYSGSVITVPSGGIPTGVANYSGGGGWNSPPYNNLATTGGTGTGLTVNVSSADGGYINISYITINTAGTGYTDGDVITINNENNIPATFTISTSQTWTLGTTGRTTFPNGVVPAHSYGAAGDKEGMVVFTDPYIYYCKQDYVDNVTDIWVRVAWTGTSW